MLQMQQAAAPTGKATTAFTGGPLERRRELRRPSSRVPLMPKNRDDKRQRLHDSATISAARVSSELEQAETQAN